MVAIARLPLPALLNIPGTIQILGKQHLVKMQLDVGNEATLHLSLPSHLLYITVISHVESRMVQTNFMVLSSHVVLTVSS